MKCHYCDNEATKTLVWLKDKRGQPAEIKVQWCGCDLMTVLKRLWANPYPVREGVDYRIEGEVPKRYTVYEWHLGNKVVAEGLTVDQVMELEYSYVKFNKAKGIASVTNCCDFKCH